MMEALLAFKRAGADGVLTYFAIDAAASCARPDARLPRHAGPLRRTRRAARRAAATGGFLWVGSARRVFEVRTADLQAALQRWTGGQLVDLHVSDLLNNQLPSHFDDTSWYDLLVFRRLAAGAGSQALFVDDSPRHAGLGAQGARLDRHQPGGLRRVRPCAADRAPHRLRGARLLRPAAARHGHGGQDQRGAARLPTSPADLMLRMTNHMVDSYLDLRRLLTRHLGTLQQELLDPAAASTTGTC
jgi:magnesium transporter